MSGYRVIVEDLVSGIIGHFVAKYEAPGKERRYIIEYKDPSISGYMSKPQKLPSTIPPEGIIEIPGTRCADGYPRIIIFSYGRDDLYPPLIPSLVSQGIGDAIKRLDELSTSAESKFESLEARQRILDRTREKVVQDAVKLGKEVSSSKKPGRSGFISMDMNDEGY